MSNSPTFRKIDTDHEPAPQPAAWYRNEWLWLAVALAVGALLRLWYLAALVNAPDFEALRQDLDVQDYHARALLSGDWTLPPHAPGDPEIATTPFYRPPGFAYYLAAVYAVSGGSYLAPRIVNMVLGLLAAILWFLLGRALFHRWAGVLAAFLHTTFWGTIYYEGEINDPALFQFLLPCILGVLYLWLRKPGAGRAILLGILIGLYATMRPNILAFGPVIALWMAFLLWKQGELRRLPASWAALLLCTLAVIAPITVRNYRVSGEFVPVSTYMGQNLLIGNAEGSDGFTSWTPYLQQLEGTGQFSVWVYPNMVRGLAREVGIPQLSHTQASEIFREKAIAYMAENKLRTLKLALKKAILFWSPKEITENKVVHYEKAHYPPLKYLPGFPLAVAAFALGSGVLLWDGRRGRLRGHSGAMVFILFSFVIIYFATFLPFFVNARARAPLYGLFFFIGAYGFYRVVAALYSGRRLAGLAGICIFVAAWIAAAVEIVPYYPDHARWHYARADSYLRAGQVDSAWQEAEAMLALPEPPMPYMPFRLGHLFAEQGKHEEAVRLLGKALEVSDESYPPAYREDLHYHIGAQMLALEQFDAAEEQLRAALAIFPEDPRALNDLGYLALQRDDLATAERYFVEAVASAPAFALVHANLGEVRERQGDFRAALRHYGDALHHAPEHPRFMYDRARMLALLGQTEEAIAQYEAALVEGPGDPRTLNNLGRLLAEQGDLTAALIRFEEALERTPRFPLPYANAADMLTRAGRLEEAMAWVRRGLDALPGSALLHFAAGQVSEAAGSSEKAREAYEEALRIAPDYAAAREALSRLMGAPLG
jgi:tetratricopeptide (TPR) repeat protein